jgi:hypothetical protein
MSSSIHDRYISLCPSLPEGAVIVAIRMAKMGEYEFLGTEIKKAQPRSSTQVIVGPAKGYSFRLKIETQSYLPAKAEPAHTAVVTFDISKPEHAEFVDKLADHPAVVSVTRIAVAPVQKALVGSVLEVVKEKPAA